MRTCRPVILINRKCHDDVMMTSFVSVVFASEVLNICCSGIFCGRLASLLDHGCQLVFMLGVPTEQVYHWCIYGLGGALRVTPTQIICTNVFEAYFLNVEKRN